jgi:hypothetical protein
LLLDHAFDTLISVANAREAKIEAWMQDALSLMAKTLRPQLATIATHQVLVVDGWDDSKEVRTAIARYLVGLRMCAIDAGLTIRAELAGTAKGKAEVIATINQIIGDKPGALSADEIAKRRNPWIAEGIWHLCMAVAQKKAACHPPGEVVALNLPHSIPSEQGLDLTVLYRGRKGYGLSIIETKAYPKNVANAMSRSTQFFREVDDGRHSMRLRQITSVLRNQLPKKEQDKVSLCLWEQRRVYVPNPHYDRSAAVAWSNPRASLGKLVPGAAGVIVMPHGIDSFSKFFGHIAAGMREAAQSL